MKKVKWLNRSLVTSSYYLTLCTNEKQFKKVLKHIKLAKRLWPEFLHKNHGACTHIFNVSGCKAAVVCMAKSKVKSSIEHKYSVLAHEAVHVWQTVVEDFSEETPSMEFEAYSIGSITYQLFTSWKKQTKGK